MFATDQDVRNLRPTTRNDIYEGITSNFNDDGLFSTVTFGRVGTPERDNRFSYIKLNTQIIHPAVYNVLKKLKSLYIDIMMGTAYATWNPETRDFEPSDMISGDTGYSFFIKHLHQLQPERRTSKRRNVYISVFEKYQRSCLMSNYLIIPAGLRDLEIDHEGRETQNEINDMYRKIISAANSINLIGGKSNDAVVDTSRRYMQLAANEVYDTLKKMLEGKQGLIVSKWGGRKINVGTRNVISPVDTTAEVLHSPRAPTVDSIQVGLYQMAKGIVPVMINRIKNRYLDDIFTSSDRPTTLIDPNTLKLTEVQLDPFIWDKWGTPEELEKGIDRLAYDHIRSKPITISGYYLYLVYETKDTFKLFRDINELPDPSMIKDVHPITYGEFYYLADYEGWYKDLRSVIVRYPVNNMRSTSAFKVYPRTTTVAHGKYELDNDWNTKLGYAREYPTRDKETTWINSAIVPFTILGNLGADFDGDDLLI